MVSYVCADVDLQSARAAGYGVCLPNPLGSVGFIHGLKQAPYHSTSLVGIQLGFSPVELIHLSVHERYSAIQHTSCRSARAGEPTAIYLLQYSKHAVRPGNMMTYTPTERLHSIEVYCMVQAEICLWGFRTSRL